MGSTPCFTCRPNALWQGWSRQPAVTGASHSWNTIKADSISMMCRWKAGGQMWRLRNSDVGWWELEPADGFPTFRARAVSCMTFFCLQKGGLLAFTSMLTLGCWADTDRDRECRDTIWEAPPPLNYSSRLLVLMERQGQEPGHSDSTQPSSRTI